MLAKHSLNKSLSQVRLAELMIALSFATDLSMGQPMGWVLRACLLAVRFAQALHATERQLRDVYYLALLHYIGCTTDAHKVAEIFGNDLGVMHYFVLIHMGELPQELGVTLNPPSPKQALSPEWQRDSSTARCEVAVRLAEWCGFWPEVKEGLWQLFERWNGEGIPKGLQGEEIVLPVRVVQIAQDAETFLRIGGVESAIAVVKERAGTGYDPKLAATFCRLAPELIATLDEAPLRQAVLDAEPMGQHRLSVSQLERALEAIADFVDIKSPFTVGHSRGVAKIATVAASHYGLEAEIVTVVRHAALLHDIGRVSVPASIWDKPASLSESEYEQVRMHSYYTERLLAQSGYLEQLGAVAALHHERLDGSGYYRRLPASMLPISARILATADIYHAMLEPRPYRPALTPHEAAEVLQGEVEAWHLDLEVVDAVLSAAGYQRQCKQRPGAYGLSPREIEVLRLLAQGLSNRAIADTLNISVKTAGHHVQHIYNKLGVSTRAAATLFAMQNELLHNYLDL